MDAAYELARALSCAAFLIYGWACLASKHMAAEFERFGLARFRTLVGALELAGGLGLLASYALPALAAPAAGGLCLLMLLGVATRARIRDPLPAALPALALAGSNAFACAYALGLVD